MDFILPMRNWNKTMCLGCPASWQDFILPMRNWNYNICPSHSSIISVDFILPMRNWNGLYTGLGIGGNSGFYLTYEELKLKKWAKPFRRARDFILPMRNWNSIPGASSNIFLKDFILPMRNWNQISWYKRYG